MGDRGEFADTIAVALGLKLASYIPRVFPTDIATAASASSVHSFKEDRSGFAATPRHEN